MRRGVMVIVLLRAAACNTGSEPSRIDVKDNDLGIVALEIDRVEVAGNTVVVLRGLSTDGEERGSVSVTRGVVAFPGDKHLTGSEIVVAVDGSVQRALSRETRQLTFDAAIARQPRIARFLALDEVVATLQREANVSATGMAARPTLDRAYQAYSCDPADLMPSPLAQQCCVDGDISYTHMVFLRDSQQTIVERMGAPYGCTQFSCEDPFSHWKCAGPEGEACAGSSCYYGPNGFARATLYPAAPSYAYVAEYPPGYSNSTCTWGYSESPEPSPAGFGDVTGTFPSGQGCPGGEDGAGEWDF